MYIVISKRYITSKLQVIKQNEQELQTSEMNQKEAITVNNKYEKENIW